MDIEAVPQYPVILAGYQNTHLLRYLAKQFAEYWGLVDNRWPVIGVLLELCFLGAF